jgi:hypothetical protein
MTQEIAALTHEQAQRALLSFYDSLPTEYWEGNKKPSLAEIESTAEDLQDRAPAEIQPFIAALGTREGDAAKGEAAKTILNEFHQYEFLRPHVAQAIAKSREPHMAPIPVIIGAFILVLAVIPREIITPKVHIKIGLVADAAKLVGELTKFVQALPTKWLLKSK